MLIEGTGNVEVEKKPATTPNRYIFTMAGKFMRLAWSVCQLSVP
ncbi:MAG: hypothetical protein VYA99_04485 [Pseudomonadota bacterium]|nr:hypothetical protein [Pseudomonadota bacterium]